MKARISAIAVCVSSWLLAGSAMAAGPFSSASKNPTPQFHSANRDFLQSSIAVPSQLQHVRGGGRRGSTVHRDFPASPPTGGMPAMDTLMPLAEMTPRPSVDYRQTGSFRFNRNGGAVVREISRGYNRMCDSLSGHVWNEPDGKRICFDTRGKPGIAIQIPIR